MKNLLILAVGLMATTFPAFAEIHDLHDGHIKDVVITASNIAIEAGKLAQSKTSSEEIKWYAQQTVGDHTEVARSATELATRLEVTPQDNPISQGLKADGETNLAALQGLRDEEFDKTYIDQIVTFYQNMLDTIDNQLMPSASNEELKALLYNLFSPFSLHLEDAQQIQEALSQADQKS